MKPKRVLIAKLVRFGEGEEMDQEFWQKIGAEGRFSAAWEMVAEADLMRGGTGVVPRLRRDVARLFRMQDVDISPVASKLFLRKQ
jgi:hypothetical protein